MKTLTIENWNEKILVYIPENETEKAYIEKLDEYKTQHIAYSSIDYYYNFNNLTAKEVLTFCGYQDKKIDYACPQEYFNTHKGNGRIFWNYENSNFGIPLEFDLKVIPEFHKILHGKVISTLINLAIPGLSSFPFVYRLDEKEKIR